jgi:carbon-monoxide dehydrogenase medium subunit
MVAVSAGGERMIKAGDFFVDMLTTALEPGEILREIRVNTPSGRFGQAYMKVPQPASGFAVVGVAVNLTRDQSGGCGSAGIGITGVASRAYRASGVERAIVGSALDSQAMASAATHATDGVSVNGDLYASDAYRRHLAQVYTRRAIETAASRAK